MPLDQRFIDKGHLRSGVNENQGVYIRYSPRDDDLISVPGVADVVYLPPAFVFLGPEVLPAPWEFKD